LQRLTDHGQQKINELAQRYGVSTDAVMTLLQALVLQAVPAPRALSRIEPSAARPSGLSPPVSSIDVIESGPDAVPVTIASTDETHKDGCVTWTRM
jgi:hypothetical protein